LDCQNGGSCYMGQCLCPPSFVGANCSIQLTSCQQAGHDCSVWSTCSGSTCQCNSGYTGDSCQYPPGCTTICKNNATLAFPQFAGNVDVLACTKCYCSAGWTGADCGTCSLLCGNGGTPDQWCQTCTCPQYWMGAKCEIPYISASVLYNAMPKSASLDITNGTQAMMFNTMLQNDMARSMNGSGPTVLSLAASSTGSQIQITLAFHGTGANVYRQRNNFMDLVNNNVDPSDPFFNNFYTRFFVPGSVQFQTYIAPAVALGAGTITAPSVLTLLFVVLFRIFH